jgi:hypothetical protein
MRRTRSPSFECASAPGEETITYLPDGYGYSYKPATVAHRYMLHNLLATPDEVSIVYDLDFIPADSPAAQGMKAARPIWMDVQNGSTYPVFTSQGLPANGPHTYPATARIRARRRSAVDSRPRHRLIGAGGLPVARPHPAGGATHHLRHGGRCGAGPPVPPGAPGAVSWDGDDRHAARLAVASGR